MPEKNELIVDFIDTGNIRGRTRPFAIADIERYRIGKISCSIIGE
jgi:hypothetical protein